MEHSSTQIILSKPLKLLLAPDDYYYPEDVFRLHLFFHKMESCMFMDQVTFLTLRSSRLACKLFPLCHAVVPRHSVAVPPIVSTSFLIPETPLPMQPLLLYMV